MKNALTTIALCLTICPLLAEPIKSNVASLKIKSIQDSPFQPLVYVQNGLVAMWDEIDNVGIGRQEFVPVTVQDQTAQLLQAVKRNVRRFSSGRTTNSKLITK